MDQLVLRVALCIENGIMFYKTKYELITYQYS